MSFFGGGYRARTYDPLLVRQVLWPTELNLHFGDSAGDLKVGDTFRSKNFECSIEKKHALTDWWSQESNSFKAFDGKVTVVDKHTDGDKLSITLKLDGIKFNMDNDGGIILVNGFVNFKEIVVNY